MYRIILFAGRGGKKGAVEQCTQCRGTGMQVKIQQLGPGMIQQIQSYCSECRGQGERISEKNRCKTCLGKKVNINCAFRNLVQNSELSKYYSHYNTQLIKCKRQ